MAQVDVGQSQVETSVATPTDCTRALEKHFQTLVTNLLWGAHLHGLSLKPFQVTSCHIRWMRQSWSFVTRRIRRLCILHQGDTRFGASLMTQPSAVIDVVKRRVRALTVLGQSQS